MGGKCTWFCRSDCSPWFWIRRVSGPGACWLYCIALGSWGETMGYNRLTHCWIAGSREGDRLHCVVSASVRCVKASRAQVQIL